MCWPHAAMHATATVQAGTVVSDQRLLRVCRVQLAWARTRAGFSDSSTQASITCIMLQELQQDGQARCADDART